MSDVVAIPTLLTEREAAKRLGISVETLRRTVRRGEIDSYKYARKRRFAERHLADYLERALCRGRKSGSPTEGSTSLAATTVRTGIDAGSTAKAGRLARLPSELATSKKLSRG